MAFEVNEFEYSGVTCHWNHLKFVSVKTQKNTEEIGKETKY